MKITDVETLLLSCPLEKPCWMSLAPITTRSEVVVKVHTDEGIVGIGECNGGPLEVVGRVVRDGLKPLLIGQDPLNVERLWERMFRLTHEKGWGLHGWGRPQIMTAISGVDIALWDLMGKVAGQPVSKLLGGYRDRVPAYATGGYYQEGKTTADLVAETVSFVEEYGYSAVKLKVGGVSVEEDVARVKAVRQALGDDVDIMLDANQAWDVPTAIRAAHLFEPYRIRWFEEPLHWYESPRSLSQVAASIHIPVASGEGEITPYGCRELIEMGGISIIQFDMTMGGGITAGRWVAALARARGIWFAPHHDPQVSLHLVAAVPNGLILESFPHRQRDPFWADLYSQRPEIVRGWMAVPDRPGFGTELDEAAVKRYAIQIT